ncbi:MAG: 23S rRNA (adenine(2503)-C(2))-methyltransferase RlmN [Candidatus Marinimicrobia bacterium]|nr:23S rRNA (adenine(2503)-C(2))-methyltransferase RlmN [Candidatus Neomarinimicrobiota bacterium]
MIKSVKNLDYEEMQEWAVSKGLKPFVGRQIFEWIYQKGIHSTNDMHNISKNVQDILDEEGSLVLLDLETQEISNDDDSEKFLFKCKDGYAIETVLLHSGHHYTLCVSSEIGCAMGCTFCKTGDMGLKRKLTSGEIVEQVILAKRISDKTISNIVFMGMGEPFNNYAEVIKAARIINHEKGLNIGARHITVSTSGIVPYIREFAHLPFQFKLAISLNSANNSKRSELMPINRRYPLDDLLSAAKYYTIVTNKLVTFGYVLLKGVNDTAKDAHELIEKLSSIPSKLNVIPYNETDGRFERPSEKDIHRFLTNLENVPFAVTLRFSGGRGIKAACGQLYHEVMNS